MNIEMNSSQIYQVTDTYGQELLEGNYPKESILNYYHACEYFA